MIDYQVAGEQEPTFRNNTPIDNLASMTKSTKGFEVLVQTKTTLLYHSVDQPYLFFAEERKDGWTYHYRIPLRQIGPVAAVYARSGEELDATQDVDCKRVDISLFYQVRNVLVETMRALKIMEESK